MTPAAADLAFLAPGFVHHLGNVLFAMQGHVLQADAAAAGPALQAIAGQVDRSASALRLFRHAIGDAGPEPAPVARTLLELAELARVGAREAGVRLEVAAAEPVGRSVDLSNFVPATLAAIRALLAAIPSGMPAVVHATWSEASGRLRLAVAPQAGSLPFPLDLPGAAAAWTQRAHANAWPWRLDASVGQFELVSTE